MSYLGFPRLHFCGRFQADPSTVNNDPEHFDDARFRARYQEPGRGATNGWWNPGGTGAWRLRDCRVTQVVYADGGRGGDPVVGGVLLSNDDRASAKIVDLDPEQQMVSTIFGLRLKLVSGDGSAVFAGEFAPAPFADIWPRFPQGQPDSFFGAAYQSVIAGVAWGQDVESPFVQELRAASAGGVLSIKFNVDGFDDDSASPTFTWGRVVGTVGPYLAEEPQHFLAERVMTPAPGSSLNNAPFAVDRAGGRLLIDLGNSLPTTSAGGPLADLGVLQVACRGHDGMAVFGNVDTTSSAFNDTDAGIATVRLAPGSVDSVMSSPVSVLDPAGNALLAERPDGRYVRADEVVFRMYSIAPDNAAATTVYATTFGTRTPGARIKAWMDDSVLLGQVKQGPVSGPPVAVPAEALAMPETVETGPDGTAQLTFTAGSPDNRRGYIDGQVYGVAYGWDGDPTTAGPALSFLVWDEYTAPESPTWADDVQPVLQQYANLYPVMRDIVDLASYHSVRERWEMLDLVFNLPITDPNSMPVTRDLSPGKRAMLLKWLESPDQPLQRLDNVASLRRALQTALELEHATIPAYLYALFSLKPGRNREVAEIIRGIVVEEMMHMALAANILNAVGGTPVLDRPAFVPRYPGHLPGSVRPDLVVTLRRCSTEQICDVFMAIEEPMETLDGAAPDVDTSAIAVHADGAPHGPVQETVKQLRDVYTGLEHHPYTIGWFYGEIARAIDTLGPDVFTGDPARQITPEIWPKAPGRLYRVTRPCDAFLAIHEIVEQGEGTSVLDPRSGPHELAHYFRFREIVEGHRLVETTDGSWTFTGPEVPFDPAGVWPVVDDPQLADIESPAAQRQAALFDQAYAGLLRSLHAVMNGDPKALASAVGLMFGLEVLAQKLVQEPIAPGSDATAGPLFDFG